MLMKKLVSGVAAFAVAASALAGLTINAGAEGATTITTPLDTTASVAAGGIVAGTNHVITSSEGSDNAYAWAYNTGNEGSTAVSYDSDESAILLTHTTGYNRFFFMYDPFGDTDVSEKIVTFSYDFKEVNGKYGNNSTDNDGVNLFPSAYTGTSAPKSWFGPKLSNTAFNTTLSDNTYYRLTATINNKTKVATISLALTSEPDTVIGTWTDTATEAKKVFGVQLGKYTSKYYVKNLTASYETPTATYSDVSVEYYDASTGDKLTKTVASKSVADGTAASISDFENATASFDETVSDTKYNYVYASDDERNVTSIESVDSDNKTLKLYFTPTAYANVTVNAVVDETTIATFTDLALPNSTYNATTAQLGSKKYDGKFYVPKSDASKTIESVDAAGSFLNIAFEEVTGYAFYDDFDDVTNNGASLAEGTLTGNIKVVEKSGNGVLCGSAANGGSIALGVDASDYTNAVVSFKAHFGYFMNNNYSTYTLSDKNGVTIASFKYDTTNKAITEVTVGSTTKTAGTDFTAPTVSVANDFATANMKDVVISIDFAKKTASVSIAGTDVVTDAALADNTDASIQTLALADSFSNDSRGFNIDDLKVVLTKIPTQTVDATGIVVNGTGEYENDSATYYIASFPLGEDTYKTPTITWNIDGAAADKAPTMTSTATFEGSTPVLFGLIVDGLNEAKTTTATMTSAE
jgi:hypothetical protein